MLDGDSFVGIEFFFPIERIHHKIANTVGPSVKICVFFLPFFITISDRFHFSGEMKSASSSVSQYIQSSMDRCIANKPYTAEIATIPGKEDGKKVGQATIKNSTPHTVIMNSQLDIAFIWLSALTGSAAVCARVGKNNGSICN